ncbi:MAG TPA: LptE family protein [Bryobacteraceae bacterium]|nr:LptE family protein [Bryobacteraceae bacterium]
MSRLPLLAAFCALASCGYHMAGHSSLLPANLKTIAVPAFTNTTTRYQLTDRLPEAISREFLARTNYRVVSDTSHADAVLSGIVISYLSFPTVIDPKNSRAAAVEVRVTMQLKLTERATGKTLFDRPNFEVRERYEISQNNVQYFEESETALSRASQIVAQAVVSAILNNF